MSKPFNKIKKPQNILRHERDLNGKVNKFSFVSSKSKMKSLQTFTTSLWYHDKRCFENRSKSNNSQTTYCIKWRGVSQRLQNLIKIDHENKTWCEEQNWIMESMKLLHITFPSLCSISNLLEYLCSFHARVHSRGKKLNYEKGKKKPLIRDF